MDSNLKNIVELFLENYRIMKKEFPWQYSIIQMMSAMIYAGNGKTIIPSNIIDARDAIKSKTGIFSQFRGNSNMIISTYLSKEINMNDKFTRTIDIYNRLKKSGAKSSEFLAMAAYNIADKSDIDQYDIIIERFMEIYKGMKKKHRFITGQDDYVYISMMAMTNINIDEMLLRIENIYEMLHEKFASKNGVQGLAQILALSSEADEVLVQRTFLTYEKLKENKYNLKGNEYLPVIGILTLLSVNTDLLIKDIIEVSDYLKTQKGFSIMHISKVQRVIFAISLVGYSNVDNIVGGAINSALSTSITNIMIAQQAAVMAAASGAAAAAASASN